MDNKRINSQIQQHVQQNGNKQDDGAEIKSKLQKHEPGHKVQTVQRRRRKPRTCPQTLQM